MVFEVPSSRRVYCAPAADQNVLACPFRCTCAAWLDCEPPAL